MSGSFGCLPGVSSHSPVRLDVSLVFQVTCPVSFSGHSVSVRFVLCRCEGAVRCRIIPCVVGLDDPPAHIFPTLTESFDPHRCCFRIPRNALTLSPGNLLWRTRYGTFAVSRNRLRSLCDPDSFKFQTTTKNQVVISEKRNKRCGILHTVNWIDFRNCFILNRF